MKTKSTTVSIRVSAATKKKLDAVAKSQRRSKSFIAGEAVEDYLWLLEWRNAELEKASAEFEKGDGVAHEDVVAWLKTWGSDGEKSYGKE
jgi:predicted transcriptional regulator